MVFILIIRVFIIKKLVFILKKLVFILNRGLMSKTGFYSEKLVSFIFIIYSKTENILSLELQCMNIPTTNRQQTTKKKKKIRALPISSIRKRNKSIIRLRFMFHKKKRSNKKKKN